MAGETVTIENGPETEAAKTAAEAANLAAQAAVATAANLGAQAASAAERAVEEISEQTAEELAEQESELEGLTAWSREHTRSFAEHQNAVNQILSEQRTEIQALRQTTGELLTGMQALMKSLAPQPPATESLPTAETPPETPPEGAAVQREAATPRRRRLI